MVDPTGESPLIIARPKHSRRHHRRKRQGHDAGDKNRTREGKRKFAEQRPGQTALNSNRRINRGERNRHGHDRTDQFPRTEERRLQGIFPLLHVALNIFHDDNRIIHNEPYRQHDGEERQQVDRESHQQHQQHGSNQRNRNGGNWNQHRPQRSHEKEDDEHHDDERLAERFDDFVDRIVDVGRRVIRNAELDSGRHGLFDLWKGRANGMDDIQRIRGRKHPDAHERGGFSVKTDLLVIVLCAEHDVGNFPEPHNRAVRLFDRQLAEFIGRLEIGVGDEVHRNHRAFCASDRGQVVVRLKRFPDIGRGNIESRHSVGFEPDPHGKRPVAKDLRALDAIDRSEFWLNNARQVISDLIFIQVVRIKTEIHRGELVVRRLEFDLRCLGLRRKIVPDLGHLGLDLSERSVRVEIELQMNLDRAQALRTGRVDVIDPVRAGDHALQRSRDVSADQVGIRSDIGGAHRDHRHIAAGILANRENLDGDEPAQQDQQIDDQCQHRTPDENIGERHG